MVNNFNEEPKKLLVPLKKNEDRANTAKQTEHKEPVEVLGTLLDTNELNRRGLRPTQEGGVEAKDRETGLWTNLSPVEVEELKQDLERRED